MHARQCSALPLLVLCAASVLARPDCNACFMKNAAKDLAHGTSTAASPTSSRGTGEDAASSDPVHVRPKRTARAAWDHDHDTHDLDREAQSRLRDELLAENANNAPEQWWDDSAVDVNDSAARWPYRGRWREVQGRRGQGRQGSLRVGQSNPQSQGQGQGAWGDVADALATPQKAFI